ncbi:AMP-binding enzyme family protein [Dirofilaria immitis]|nr:AMP-binding enzyme family protein [Dirofilaria immitis]
MIPNDYVFVQEFPLSINGKIDRKLLSILSISEKLPNSRSSLKIDYIFEPREKKIMEVFTALLPGKTIQLEDSFFEVGGDSLKALIAIQNIKRETGLNLQLRDIFELTSFRAILERLKDNYSTDSHEELENSKKLKFEKFESNLLQIHSKPDKLTSDHLININNMLTEDSDEFMDKEKTVKRRMSWESEKIYSDDKQKNRFWSDLSIPISLQQERLLFLYSFGEEYRESYKIEKTSKLSDSYDIPLLTIIISNNRQLLLTLDHLIIDGRSIAILSNDLVEFYNRLISGGSVSSDVSKDCSYAEFCLKQRSQLEKFQIALKSDDSHSSTKDELQLQEECRNLKEMIRKLQNFPPLSLQGDLSNEDSDRRNNVIKFKMPVDLSAIKHFCTTERCTLFAYLLCIFSLTIQSIQANKHQQKYRFAIVSSALNRTSDTMNCVGLFVNNIIIPIDITFQSISELIRNLQQNIANVLQFQHIPFDYIIQKLNPKRSSTDTETYQISFVVQNASPIKLPKIDGVETVTEEIGAKYAKFDQAWYCTEFEDYIEILVQDILKYSKLANVEKLLSDNENQENMIEVQNTIEKNWMLEESLLDIWKEVLGSDEITIFDNFFARGGHSLLIPNICYKIEQQINYQCPPKAIFKYQTVKELAEYISNKQNSKFLTTSKQILKIHVCPLQESLLRMYYNLAEEAVASISSSATSAVNTTTTLAADFIKAYQTGFSISLKSIDLIKLRQSLNLIIMRHSSLRTTFYCQNNNFYQEIHSGTENYIIPRKITSKQASLIVPNPFHTIPILCWLDDDIKQELADDDNHSAVTDANHCAEISKFAHFHQKSSQKCCCTPFVVQLAAFSKVLSGIVIQASKVIISCPVDMRDSEAQQCVGMCINVLPVIINLKHRNFQDLIQNVAKSLADAYLNADISIEEIEKLCEKHGISNFADIMIVNNYEEYSDGCYQILNDSSEFTKCALTLFLMQHQEDIVAKIEFKQHLFYNESMHIMLNQWAKIIRRMEMLIVANDEMKYKQKQKCLYGIPFNGENYNAEKG